MNNCHKKTTKMNSCDRIVPEWMSTVSVLLMVWRYFPNRTHFVAYNRVGIPSQPPRLSTFETMPIVVEFYRWKNGPHVYSAPCHFLTQTVALCTVVICSLWRFFSHNKTIINFSTRGRNLESLKSKRHNAGKQIITP